MNQVLKAVIGAVTTVGLLGSAVGTAQAAIVAAGASSNAFVPDAAADANISHDVGRFVTNVDTVFSRNAVASLGTVVTPTSVSTVTVHLYLSNATSGSVTCWAIFVNLATGADFAPSGTWGTTAYGDKTIVTSVNPGTKYAVSVFCGLPPMSGANQAKIYGTTLEW